MSNTSQVDVAAIEMSPAEADHWEELWPGFMDAEYVETTVVRQLEGGEVTLRVPEQYFEDAWDQAGGFRDTAQLFAVEIRTFAPITRAEEGRRNRQGIWNWMHFLSSLVNGATLVDKSGMNLRM